MDNLIRLTQLGYKVEIGEDHFKISENDRVHYIDYIQGMAPYSYVIEELNHLPRKTVGIIIDFMADLSMTYGDYMKGVWRPEDE